MYDAAGNRQTATTNGVAETYSVNSSNRYLQIGAVTAGYDVNVKLTSGVGGYTYSYDGQSRLKTSNSPGSTVTLIYDGLHRCIARTIDGATTFHYYDIWNLVEERNSGGALVLRYVHGPVTDEIIATV